MNMHEHETESAAMNRHLLRIDRALNSPWRAFVRGTFQGLGGIVGATIVIVIISWILNAIGIIPEFKEYVDDFKMMLQDIRTK